jgi:hypothetical protein
MLPRPEAKTLAEGAFFEIKSDILRSRFPPGHWLRLDELRETTASASALCAKRCRG